MPGSTLHAVSRARALCAALTALTLLCLLPASAPGASPLKVVSYRGYRVSVPRSWPVFDLSRNPSVCVRFNRHAVYLGTPGGYERCPAHAAGRTEALLIEPSAAPAAAVAAAAVAPLGAAPRTVGAAGGSLVDHAHGVIVTATWRGAGEVIRRALGLRSLRALSAPSRPAAPAVPRRGARAASAAAAPGAIYTGPGFDACSTPSASSMAAWGSSPYRALGVYIGGANRACAQPNLSSAWVSQESAAGWHLMPIYVGLQAPSNSCGCAGISSASAASQGAAAASDAVTEAQSLGLGPGNPVYFDMEAYARGGGNSQAVLSFLAAWTTQLHQQGYSSGVYSSDASGISDLVSQYGTGYTEPDDIWIANWNGQQSTADPNVPSGDWPAHQRLHQYQGAHNETYGGATINIDGDYLDAVTAAAGATAGAAAEWSASVPPSIAGRAVVGQTLNEGHGTWPGSPTAYAYQWEDCNSAGTGCVGIPAATGVSYTVAQSDLGHTIRVLETASNGAATSVPATSRATAAVLSPTPLYWLYTASGNVYPSLGTAWYGSPSASRYHGSSVTGMAASSDGGGYWLLTTAGGVFAYGDARRLPGPRLSAPVRGIVTAPRGGYWLYSAFGNVYPARGTAWYGSPATRGFRGATITGMAATPDGRGYWLVTNTGRVYAFGDARRLSVRYGGRSVAGIVAAPRGYWLYTAQGGVIASPGSAVYGSPAGSRYRGSSVVGMTASSDGKGYWLVTSAGTLYTYGDAIPLLAPKPGRRVTGIAG